MPIQNTIEPLLLSVEDAAQMLGCRPETIQGLIDARKVSVKRLRVDGTTTPPKTTAIGAGAAALVSDSTGSPSASASLRRVLKRGPSTLPSRMRETVEPRTPERSASMP